MSLENGSLAQIYHFSKACLRTYVGKVDLIVLGGYVVSLALELLEREYPQQKFISVGVNYYRILNSRAFPNQIAIMANKALFETKVRTEICRELPYSTIILPDCSGWDQLINDGQMSTDVLRSDLGHIFALRPSRRKTLRHHPRTLRTHLTNQTRSGQTSCFSSTRISGPSEKILKSSLAIA